MHIRQARDVAQSVASLRDRLVGRDEQRVQIGSPSLELILACGGKPVDAEQRPVALVRELSEGPPLDLGG